MSDFKYLEKDTDAFGHVMYICKCSGCGERCTYLAKTSTPALCPTCRQRKHNKDTKRRTQIKPLNELVKAVNGYYAIYDAMPSKKIFEELVEAVLNDIS